MKFEHEGEDKKPAENEKPGVALMRFDQKQFAMSYNNYKGGEGYVEHKYLLNEEKNVYDLHMHFPMDMATVMPFEPTDDSGSMPWSPHTLG